MHIRSLHVGKLHIAQYARIFPLFWVVAAFVVGLTSSLHAQTQLPQTVYVWSPDSQSYDQRVLMSSLAGIVNRTTNGEVLIAQSTPAQPSPRFWLEQLRAAYPQVQTQNQNDSSW